MKVLAIVLASVLAAVAALATLLRLGAPAALLLAALLGIVGWLTLSVRKDRHTGWGNFRALGVMALLASGVWLLVSLASGAWLIALPTGAAFLGSVWWILHCNRQLRAAISHGAGSVGMADLNDEAANAFVRDTIEDNRRSHARGQSLQLQAENLELAHKNRSLEAEVARLRAEVSRLDGALHDPFYDPT